ncbi:MAG: phosphoenolpyruvate--protein phosphotransferase [Vicinamibacterales bacterium]
MDRLTGIGVSPGLAVGRAVVLTQRAEVVRFPIPEGRVPRELEALEQARAVSTHQLAEIRDRIRSAHGADLAALFDAQLLMLEDALFLGRAQEIIRTEQVNAAWAVHRAYEELRRVFESVEDPYLRERESDVADVAGRLQLNLRHGLRGPRDLLSELDGPSILIADELTASVAAQLDWSRIQGFATDAGSRTHHTAILARSLKIPAVVGLHDASLRITAGSTVVLDGTSGDLAVGLPDDALEEATARAARLRRQAPARRTSLAHGPAVTSDGVRIRIQANVELLEDLSALGDRGAEGIGLYRSEFMLTGRGQEMATEDAQYEVYASLLDRMAPHAVTVRTFDLDERQMPAPPSRLERQRGRPGLRGLRLGLAHPDLLRTQLRALVRASTAGRLRIMFPFVSAVEEIRQVRAMLNEVVAEVGVVGGIPVGAMIEVPAAALAADLLAREVDFFTLGTNDLIQYTLAVDRTDDRVSDLYEPLHPAVLRLIRLVRRAAMRQRIPVSLCGEMAADPALLGLLIGLGLTEFSMTPAAIPVARRVVADVHAGEARTLANRALSLATAAEIEEFLFDALAASAGGHHA